MIARGRPCRRESLLTYAVVLIEVRENVGKVEEPDAQTS